MISRVLICGASPDNHNRNVVLRQYVADGFAQIPGIADVVNAPLEHAALHFEVLRPELVLCFGSCMPDDADYAQVRRYCDRVGVPLAFWLHDDPYEFDYQYKLRGVADIVFSNDRWAAEHYDHPHAYPLALAASEAAHWREIDSRKDVNLFFCGVAFGNRIRLLRDLAPTLIAKQATILGDGWPADLPFCDNRRLQNESLSAHYNRAWLTLNMGRDFHYANDRFKLEPSTPGPRTFEAAMSGTTQMFFVESLEIADYYAPGSEILLYNSAAEFKALIEWMHDDRETCLRIARAAQGRTLRDHTYRNRAEEILARVTVAGI